MLRRGDEETIDIIDRASAERTWVFPTSICRGLRLMDVAGLAGCLFGSENVLGEVAVLSFFLFFFNRWCFCVGKGGVCIVWLWELSVGFKNIYLFLASVLIFFVYNSVPCNSESCRIRGAPYVEINNSKIIQIFKSVRSGHYYQEPQALLN